VCCGRTLISKGFLSQARENARTNVQALAPYVEQGLPIVGLEPSCVAAFKDDYLDLVDDPRARVLATGFHLLEDFLAALARDGRLHLEFTSTRRRILVHGHCQQKALMDPGATVEVLNLPPHFEAAEIPSGCCGMAGSFGYEKEHYDVSLRVGEERLFQAVRAAPPEVEIAAVGTSCRQQIRDVTGRRVRHWAEIMVEAL
jgi:Fe-S oxidoreductase